MNRKNKQQYDVFLAIKLAHELQLFVTSCNLHLNAQISSASPPQSKSPGNL